MDGVNFGESFIVYSGRMPADMLIKVVRAGGTDHSVQRRPNILRV